MGWGAPGAVPVPLTLPVPLSPACLFRFNVLSLVYLLYLLLLPWFPGPADRAVSGEGTTTGARAGGFGAIFKGQGGELPSSRYLPSFLCGFLRARRLRAAASSR